MNSSENGERHRLCLFDQHAVDERINLESLMKGGFFYFIFLLLIMRKENYKYCFILEYRSELGNFLSSEMASPIAITLDSAKIQVLKDYERRLFHYGVGVKKFTETQVIIDRAPICLLEKDKQDVSILNKV